VRGILRASPPRVRSLAAFGRRPPVDVARLALAGIRNPAQQRTLAMQQEASLFDHPISASKQHGTSRFVA
jgi:hypothetical protein